jgi:hypothetical protein
LKFWQLVEDFARTNRMSTTDPRGLAAAVMGPAKGAHERLVKRVAARGELAMDACLVMAIAKRTVMQRVTPAALQRIEVTRDRRQ